MALAWASSNPITSDEAAAFGVSGTTDQVTAAVNAASALFETECGVAMVAKSYTERHRGGSSLIFLRRYPVASVTSIVDEGTSVRTILAAEYSIRKAGVLEYIAGAWPAAFSGQNIGDWVVTYSAGWFGSVGAVTWDVKNAVAELAKMIRTAAPGAEEIDAGGLRIKFDLSAELPPAIRQVAAAYRIRLLG